MEVKNDPRISKNTMFYVYWYHRAYQQGLQQQAESGSTARDTHGENTPIPGNGKLVRASRLKPDQVCRSRALWWLGHDRSDGHVSSSVVFSWSTGHTASITTTTTPNICWRVTTLSHNKHPCGEERTVLWGSQQTKIQTRPLSSLWSAGLQVRIIFLPWAAKKEANQQTNRWAKIKYQNFFFLITCATTLNPKRGCV